jgi:hypothetical protein
MRFRSKEHWGVYLWGFIHTITIIDYNETDNEEYGKNIKKVLKELKDCFPCGMCESEYKKYVKRLDVINISKPMSLFYWSVDLHNAVNKKLKKVEWTYEMALMKWCKSI